MKGETQGNALLHELFEEQARRTPEAPAVVGPWGTMTYGELDRQTGRLAAHLRTLGVRPDVTVGVYMERRPEFVVACLAALRAGGAFLPLELAYPDSMIEDVLADAEPRVVVTRGEHEASLPDGQERIVLDGDWESALPEGGPDDGLRPTLDDLAFVSYSSGTTGKPKGIANPHRAPVNSYSWRFGLVDYGAGDVVGCNVFFIWEMLRPLLRGGAVCPIPDDVIYDPAALVGYLDEHGITEVLFTPSLLEAVLDGGGENLGEELSALRTLWLNGEVVTKTLARRALRLLLGKRIFNLYSISETHEISAGELEELVESADSTYCPVGKPADPEHLYILDEDARPVEGGAAGELYVGGEGLARGYLKLPEKTAERFVPDPYAGGDARMYRSGDKARLLPDGNLEIMGRVDFMVKVRGYSIELGAVEAAIEERLAVTNCVVIAEGEEGTDKRLVAYLVPDSGDGANDDRHAEWNIDPATGHSPGIRRVLQDALPHYMIPAVYVEVEALPLQDTTGKVDRGNLPTPPARGPSEEAAPEELALPADAPRGEKEDRLARIFERVLRLERGYVRPEDDFFEAGGHSLAAAELVSRVEEAFGVRLPTSEILDSPTVTGLCDAIEARQNGEDGAGQETDEPDLRAEVLLEPEISPDAAGRGGERLSDAGNVFLTGATGFLGAFLLDGLLTETEARVHCLVRPRHDGDPMTPLRDGLKRYGLWDAERASRIVPVPGDLAEPLLGLSEEDFDNLAGEVDVVFHAGAVVNLIYPYSALKPANVDGTREVLRLACRQKTKPVHHVSTNGVFGRGWGLCEEDTNLDGLAGVQGDGYGRSKWVAEGLVREAAGRGLSVAVYRPGNISGHSETGASNPKDFLGAVISESVRVGSAPKINGWRMEMTPVDFVSGTILRFADDPDAAGKTFHLANPNPPSAEYVFGWIEDLGYDLRCPDYADWLETIRSAPAETEAGEVVRGAAPDDAAEVKDDNDYDDRNTRDALGEGGPRRPEVGAALLETYARAFAERGWMPAPDLAREGARR